MTFVAAALVLAGALCAQEGPDEPEPAATTRGAEIVTPGEWPSNELSRERPSEAEQDDKAYHRALGEQERNLRLGLSATPGKRSADRCRFHVAFANFVLSKRFGAILGRELIDGSLPGSDSVSFQLAEEAHQQLLIARDYLTALDAEDWENAEEHARVEKAISVLLPFASAAKVLFAAETDIPQSEEQLRRAASELAIATEDESAELVAASTLWQALLFVRAAQVDRALNLLPLCLEPPKARSPTLEFFSRLLRCRLMAAKAAQGMEGGYTTAWALTLQLENAVDSWFTEPASKTEAVNACILLRRRILDDWREARGSQATPQECEWFDRAEQRLREQLPMAESEVRILRLTDAVPVLVPVETNPDAHDIGQP